MFSSSEITRDASLMSVWPWQNVTNPSVVPGPSTAALTPVLADWKFSATSDEIGSTVDEPEMLSEPVRSPPDAPLDPLEPLLSLLLPHAAATSEKARIPVAMPTQLRAFAYRVPPSLVVDRRRC